jgi:tetratricopeptide (TPR) repeat protein
LACERFSSPAKAEGFYRRALEIAPAHADAHFALGDMLLRRRDAAGIAHLDKAIADGGGRAMEATSMAARFLREAGRDRDAERYETKSMAQAAREEEREMDRVFLLPDDNYAPHGLSDKELSLCRATFKRLHRVYSVHAVKKILPGAGEPHLVLMVQQREGVVGIVSKIALSMVGVPPKEDWSLADEVLEKLRLPIDFTVFIDLYVEDEIVARVRDVQDSLVFDDSDR